jgi:ubiquitin-protein ligase
MANPRLNRLRRDYEKLQELAARSPFISIQETQGTPPEKYVLHLTCKGITDIRNGNPVYSESHRLGIHLHQEYPRKGPRFEMLTPIYHPNIARNGQICIGDEGDHGFAPSMPLDDLVIRIINIIRYENIGLNSAFNYKAAQWAHNNQSLFPIDTRRILLEELEINILDDIQITEDEGADDLEIVIY